MCPISSAATPGLRRSGQNRWRPAYLDDYLCAIQEERSVKSSTYDRPQFLDLQAITPATIGQSLLVKMCLAEAGVLLFFYWLLCLAVQV